MQRVPVCAPPQVMIAGWLEGLRANIHKPDFGLQGLGNDYTSKDDYARLPWPVLEKK